MSLIHALRRLARNPGRSLLAALGLALAIGLFAGIAYFVDASSRAMTATAVAPLRVDLIAKLVDPAAYASAQSMADRFRTMPGLSAARPVLQADFASIEGSSTPAPPRTGRIFGIDSAFLGDFGLLDIREGSFSSDGALISEELARSRSITPGATITMIFPADPLAGAKALPLSVQVKVTGIVDMTKADSLFATGGEAENAAFADVVFVDRSFFEQRVAALVLPSAGPGNLQARVFINVDRTSLPPDPNLAALRSATLKRLVERAYPGAIQAQDELSGLLKTASADAVNAKILFIFLGLPGVALALFLAAFSTKPAASARSREIVLLRTRGASPRFVALSLAWESLLLSLLAGLLGVVFGLALLSAPGGGIASPLGRDFNWHGFAVSTAVALGLGIAAAFLSLFLPALSAARRELYGERKAVDRGARRPFAERYALDFVALAASALVYVVTSMNGGFKPTGNEGAAVSLSVYVFLSPFLAWIGATFLALRLTRLALSRSPKLAERLFSFLFGALGAQAGRSLSRRIESMAQAAAVIGLTLSFGVSLAVFQSTYSREKLLEARYVVGSDIRVTPSLRMPVDSSYAEGLKGPDVLSVTGVARDVKALVGNEKNTVYGIDAASFAKTAWLPDSFFVDETAPSSLKAFETGTGTFADGKAAKVLSALASTPNGVIISVEQAQKYGIMPGDSVKIRLNGPVQGSTAEIEAKAVGFFRWFPTSSLDSDFILNRDFMTTASGYTGIDYFLVKTRPGMTDAVAKGLASTVGKALSARIESTSTAIMVDQSSLTSMSLRSLGLMESVYVAIIASFGLGVFLMSIVRERRKEFGTMRALGATSAQMRVFLSVETLGIAAIGAVLAIAVGLPLAVLQSSLLAVIFTIPPSGLALPPTILVILFGGLAVGAALGHAFAGRSMAGLRVAAVLREE